MRAKERGIMLRETKFKVCYYNHLLDKEVTILTTSDYGKALQTAHTSEADVEELYVKIVMVKERDNTPILTASTGVATDEN